MGGNVKLAFCGPGRCGKDAAAEWLRDHTSMRYVAGTSWFAAPMVFERLTDAGFSYATVEECWRDRHRYRNLWADLISEYNRVDPARLYRECMSQQDALTGVRWRREKNACEAADLVKLWIWIERPGIEPDSTMEFTAGECDIVIRNDGTLADFYRKLYAFADALGIVRPGVCRPVRVPTEAKPTTHDRLPGVLPLKPGLRVVRTDGTLAETGVIAGQLFHAGPRRGA